MACISEFVINRSIFLSMNNNNDNMCCKYSGRMFNFLNNLRHNTLLPVFIIILIALFCNLKMLLLMGELPQKIILYVMMECT